MAGAAPRRSRDPTINTPSAASDDENLPDVPLADAPVDEDSLGQQQYDAAAVDEVGPLGAHLKEALSIASDLAQLGLSTQEISIPRCVVLGQQSSGKSSVIEAISGIRTPRDTGTCTRCPLFIDMQPSEGPDAAWHADVYLIRQFDLHHPGHGETPFPGWAPASTPGRVLFAQTNDPAQLEELIACAQRATLSPMVDHKLFLDPAYRNVQMQRSLFSPNPVGISIKKPGAPPLSFFDLPGLIGQAETPEEAYTVALVRNLVSMYVKDSESLVLVTTSLESDIAASTAAGFARELEASDRCIGVLTKPDRFAGGSSSADLTKVLAGKSYALGHGYFVVRNLDQTQIKQGLTHSDARHLEQEFFNTTTPWSTNFQEHQSRFGTVNLQQYLSFQLGNRVAANLPLIHQQIQHRLDQVEAELSEIPETPLNTAIRTVSDVLLSFASEARNEMEGEHGHTAWWGVWEEERNTFWQSLKEMKPSMMTSGSLDNGIYNSTLPGHSKDAAIVIDESDEDVHAAQAPETPSKKRKTHTPTKREAQAQTPAPRPSPLKRTLRPSSTASQVLFPETATKTRLSFRLDQIAEHIRRQSKSRVPGQCHTRVREDLMMLPLKAWPPLVDSFFTKFEIQVRKFMEQLFHHHFQHWQGSGLYKESWTIVQGILDNELSFQRTTMAADSLQDEQERPYIYQREIFNAEKAEILKTYTAARANARQKLFLREAADQQEQPLKPNEVIKMEKENLPLFREEPYRAEVDLIADMTTYYLFAARRLHDSICIRIESKFFKQLRSKLRSELEDGLGIYDEREGAYNAQRLLAESPDRLARRNDLVGKKNALLEGLKCFEERYRKFHGSQEHESSAAGDGKEDVRSRNLPLHSVSHGLV